MTEYLDLTHPFYEGMPGFKMKHPETGELLQYGCKIFPFRTREQMAPNYSPGVSFEITQFEFQSSVGTYLDSPYHRYANGRDIGSLELNELILEGFVVDATNTKSQTEFRAQLHNLKLEGKAVLFNFGWDKYFGTDKYHQQPYLSEDTIDLLINQKVSLVGVDTINIDNSANPSRPAHTKLLAKDILIVENLCNLEKLPKTNFTFFAMPIPAVKAAAIPVRAFARVSN